MKTRRNIKYKGGKLKKSIKNRQGKKWTTAIEAAQTTLKKTGSIFAARNSLKKQALTNARKMFGSLSI
jgi:hypothetical protein